MYDIKTTKKYRKDLKTVAKRQYDMKLMDEVVGLLAAGKPLPKEYNDHALIGNWKGHRECHILPDWLLIYKIENNILILTLTRTGTHADLLE
jgi:mRNA interferase YafQ